MVSKVLPYIYLMLLATTSIVGARIVAYYMNPTILFIFIMLLSLSPMFLLSSKTLKRRALLFVFIISLSLLSHISFSTLYLKGADVFTEYFFASEVIVNHSWNSSIAHPYNSMLSVTILPAMICAVAGVNLLSVFQVIYLLIYALVPVILFKAYMLEFDCKKAFFAVFYFMSLFPFFTEVLQIAKEMIAEVILALIVYLLITSEKSKPTTARMVTLLILTIALSYSHYGTCYFWVVVLSISSIASIVLNKKTFLLHVIVIDFITIFLWYTWTSQLSIFEAAVRIGYEFITSINKLFSPYEAQGVEYVVKEKTPMHQVTTYLYLASIILVTLGLGLQIVRKYRNKELLTANDLLSIGAITLFGLAAISTLAAALNVTRFYHLTSFMLAPYFVKGLKTTERATRMRKKLANGVMAVFLAIFLLFSTGFIYELANFFGMSEPSFSGALNPLMDRWTPDAIDISGIEWIMNFNPHINYTIFSDLVGKTFLRAYFPSTMLKLSTSKSTMEDAFIGNQFLFVRYFSTRYGFLTYWFVGHVQYREYIPLEDILSMGNLKFTPKIFDNGAWIYYGAR